MKLTMKAIILALFLTLPARAVEAVLEARTATSNSEGIEVSVTANTEASNRTNITCTLTNHSEFILAAAVPISDSLCFRITLRDINGNTVLPEEEWALAHGQPLESNVSERRLMGRRRDLIRSGQTREFKFCLEEAYGNNAKNGRELEVKWVNAYSKPGTKIRIDEVRHANGTVTPAYQEENHFPGRRVFEVKLPLTDEAAVSRNEPEPSAPPGTEPAPEEKPITPVPNQVENPAPPGTFDYRWLALLLIPSLLLLIRALRARKSA